MLMASYVYRPYYPQSIHFYCPTYITKIHVRCVLQHFSKFRLKHKNFKKLLHVFYFFKSLKICESMEI